MVEHVCMKSLEICFVLEKLELDQTRNTSGHVSKKEGKEREISQQGTGNTGNPNIPISHSRNK